MSESDNSGNNVIFFLVGGAIGAAIALLFAPKSGAETRALLSDKAREGREYLATKSQELKEQASTLVDKGRDVVSSQKERLSTAIDAGRQAYREEKDKVTSQV
ncbi:MAG: YtxH domain-containing protein [Acidobacteria bacterium]|nr:YtxH domain-containing protein [Acidobacteriota bacterium]MBI3655653.1 YtxH domain-containing protein [Acidobacteriota bacterium]